MNGGRKALGHVVLGMCTVGECPEDGDKDGEGPRREDLRSG